MIKDKIADVGSSSSSLISPAIVVLQVLVSLDSGM